MKFKELLKPHLYIRFFNQSIPSFHFFGGVGYVIGLALGLGLSYKIGLSISVVLILALTAAITFIALAFLAKIISGTEYIVYYHHEIAILLLCSIVLKLLHHPVLEYLDITILSISVFLAFGRIGCFSVGCCHGIPTKKGGVIYGSEHKVAGFTKHYVGVPLLPVQLLESGFVFLISITGVWLLLNQSPPGTVLILYTIIYGAFRFTLEFFRGDPERPYWRGFSEAQWTTLVLFITSIFFSLIGWLPFYYWHFGVVASLVVFMLILGLYRHSQTIYKIKNPHHVSEIATGLGAINRERYNLKNNKDELGIPVHSTSLGVKISTGIIPTTNGELNIYTVSLSNFSKQEEKRLKFNPRVVNEIGKIIQTLQHHGKQFKVHQGKLNIYHLIFEKIKE